MLKLFRQLKISDEFILNNQVYIKVETKYTNCCTPDYNAMSLDSTHNILVPLTTTVEVKNESVE